MPEEYGWILRRFERARSISPRGPRRSHGIIGKLHVLTPAAEAVLLEESEPHAAGLRRSCWPNGRRPGSFSWAAIPGPSSIRSSASPGHDPPPGQRPVSRPAARRHPPRPGLGPDAALRLSRPGPSCYGRIALAHILRDVARELGRLEASRRAIPPRQTPWILDYSDLIEDTAGVIGKGPAAFLDTSPRQDLVTPAPRPRNLLRSRKWTLPRPLSSRHPRCRGFYCV